MPCVVLNVHSGVEHPRLSAADPAAATFCSALAVTLPLRARLSLKKPIPNQPMACSCLHNVWQPPTPPPPRSAAHSPPRHPRKSPPPTTPTPWQYPLASPTPHQSRGCMAILLVPLTVCAARLLRGMTALRGFHGRSSQTQSQRCTSMWHGRSCPFRCELHSPCNCHQPATCRAVSMGMAAGPGCPAAHGMPRCTSVAGLHMSVAWALLSLQVCPAIHTSDRSQWCACQAGGRAQPRRPAPPSCVDGTAHGVQCNQRACGAVDNLPCRQKLPLAPPSLRLTAAGGATPAFLSDQ